MKFLIKVESDRGCFIPMKKGIVHLIFLSIIKIVGGGFNSRLLIVITQQEVRIDLLLSSSSW